MGCAACAMFTAPFGGITRDVLFGRLVRILFGHCEPYAVPAFFGGYVTTAVTRLTVGSDAVAMMSVHAGTLATAFAQCMLEEFSWLSSCRAIRPSTRRKDCSWKPSTSRQPEK